MCVLRGGERGEKKSGVLISVKNPTTVQASGKRAKLISALVTGD